MNGLVCNKQILMQGIQYMIELCENRGNYEEYFPPLEIYFLAFENSKFKYVSESGGVCFNQEIDRKIDIQMRHFVEILENTEETSDDFAVLLANMLPSLISLEKEISLFVGNDG